MTAASLRISVALEFSETPGPRAPNEGKFSGEEFLSKLLLPKFDRAVSDKCKLLIDLDGAEGYATSFLESAFGGLARERDQDLVLKVLEFKCDDEPYLEDEIKRYVRQARP